MGDLESDLAHVLITFEHARSGAHRKLRRRYCLQYCAYQPHFMPYVPFGIGGGQHHSDDMKDDEGSGPRRLRQDLAKALQAVQVCWMCGRQNGGMQFLWPTQTVWQRLLYRAVLLLDALDAGSNDYMFL